MKISAYGLTEEAKTCGFGPFVFGATITYSEGIPRRQYIFAVRILKTVFCFQILRDYG